MMRSTLQCLLIFICLIYSVKSWNTDEMEIFDLVEEINRNFYEFMGINQDATSQQLKRAFRNLSVILHPDKNSAEDANIQFRNLVSIYEVLKDPSKREKYDKVLRDGLPNWKSALYYYRRVRKMGLAEMAIILFIILTIGQYFTSWAVYLERKYTAEQVFGSRKKRKNKANIDVDAIINEIPLPSVFNTLPFQIPRAIWNFPKTIKSTVKTLNEIKEKELEKRRLEAEETERQRLLEEELAREKEAKKELKETIRKRKQQAKIVPEKTDEELAGYSVLKVREFTEENAVRPVKSTKTQLSGGLWTDEDLIELVRLVKKYPGGTSNRWEIIAETMNRSVTEVTFMAAKLKENGYRVPGHGSDSVAENIVQEVEAKKIKEKTKKTQNTILVAETNWSQEQQRALEAAIMKYKKTGNADRWQKISNSVPGKTKEECLLRYKYLVDLVKAQKENETKQTNNNEEKDGERDQNVQEESSAVEECPVESDDNLPDEKNIFTEEKETNELEIPIDNDDVVVKKQGKPRNKRKERKKRQEFSDDEDFLDYE